MPFISSLTQLDDSTGHSSKANSPSPLPTALDSQQQTPQQGSGSTRPSSTSSDIKESVVEVKDVKHRGNTRPPLPRAPSTADELKRWPEKPIPITNDPTVEAFLTIFDVILCTVPILLILKAALCIWASIIDADHKGASIDQTSQLTSKLVGFDNQLVTIFTIIFIIIISNTMRRLALYKAERGASLGHIEQLFASTSLAGTLKAVWSLRAFTMTSVGLIFLWAWYYVGSQASTREYTYAESGRFGTEHIAFLGPQAASPFEEGSISRTSTVRRTDMNARYEIYSQFTAGSQSNTTTDAKTINGADIFGDTLTPWYGPARDHTWEEFIPNPEGWVHIRHMSEQPIASSMGTSLYRQTNSRNTWRPAKMIGTFTYPTSYFQANCSAPVVSNANAPQGLTPALSTSMNMTASHNGRDLPRQLSFWHWVDSTHSLTSTCDVTYRSVEINAECTAATCKPHRIRLLKTTPHTLLDDDTFATSFFDSMLLACGTPLHRGDYSLFDDDNGLVALRTLLQSNISSTSPKLSSLTAASQFPLSMSITRYINTYFTSSQMLRYEHDFQDALATNGSVALSNNPDFTFLTMNGAKFEPQHILSWPWLGADIASNCVLLIAAILSFWLRKHTLAPDIFGFVSTLTRDNRNFAMPEGGSALGGIDRARRMKHVKVKIGDVGSGRSEEGVGRIGIVWAGGKGTENREVRDLERGKVYY